MTARTYRLTEQGQLTDRYTKAIEQLGDDKLDVRLGGIYALARIAHDFKRDHPTVVEVLRPFVSEHSHPRSGRAHRRLSRSTKRIATDVQAAITVLGRLPSRDGVYQGDLTDAHLVGARLVGANLIEAKLVRANLTTEEGLTTQEQLDSAQGNDHTKLPAGLRRPAHWSTTG